MSKSTIDNRQPKMNCAKTLMQLTGYQIIAFIDDSQCPICMKQNVFWRSWRNDYLCGWCGKVYKLIEGKVYLLGNQEDME